MALTDFTLTDADAGRVLGQPDGFLRRRDQSRQ